MRGKPVRVICVGKIKTTFFAEACNHYLAQARHWRPVEIIEVKDGDGNATPEKRILQEEQRILARLNPGEKAIALTENGKMHDSPKFAELLNRMENTGITFIIGGPFGLGAQILDRCHEKLSLSSMTWPHELARVLLLEQIFRGLSILARFPYHH